VGLELEVEVGGGLDFFAETDKEFEKEEGAILGFTKLNKAFAHSFRIDLDSKNQQTKLKVRKGVKLKTEKSNELDEG